MNKTPEFCFDALFRARKQQVASYSKYWNIEQLDTSSQRFRGHFNFTCRASDAF